MGLPFFPSYINRGNFKNALVHFQSFGFRALLRKTADYLEFTKHYGKWRLQHMPTETELERQRRSQPGLSPKISIIVPTYHVPELFLSQMLDSVAAQTYSNWELCIADGSPDFTSTRKIIEAYQADFPGKILYTALEENKGISGNTNAALALATGEYIALLDHDDMLAPNALYEIAAAISQNPSIDVLYTDEDKMDAGLRAYYGPYFKPDFNLDLLRSCNYITHFYIVRSQIARQIGGFSSACDGSQDYDFILKTCELAKEIHHIPKVLYHWRIHQNSVAGDPASKNYAYDSAVRALQGHLERCRESASVSKAAQYGYYQVQYHYSGTPLVSIVLKNCTPGFQKKLQDITTYTNYEFVTRPSEARGEYLVVCCCLSDMLTPDWIEQLLGNCCRKNVGLASAKIYNKKGRVLEAGLNYTPDGAVHSPFYNLHAKDPGYCYRAMTQQNCSLAGFHCFMVKADLYRNLTKKTVSASFLHRILELCRQLRAEGYSIVILPGISAVSQKSRLHYPVENSYKGICDSFYNPNFSNEGNYHLP